MTNSQRAGDGVCEVSVVRRLGWPLVRLLLQYGIITEQIGGIVISYRASKTKMNLKSWVNPKL